MEKEGIDRGLPGLIFSICHSTAPIPYDFPVHSFAGADSGFLVVEVKDGVPSENFYENYDIKPNKIKYDRVVEYLHGSIIGDSDKTLTSNILKLVEFFKDKVHDLYDLPILDIYLKFGIQKNENGEQLILLDDSTVYTGQNAGYDDDDDDIESINEARRPSSNHSKNGGKKTMTPSSYITLLLSKPINPKRCASRSKQCSDPICKMKYIYILLSKVQRKFPKLTEKEIYRLLELQMPDTDIDVNVCYQCSIFYSAIPRICNSKFEKQPIKFELKSPPFQSLVPSEQSQLFFKRRTEVSSLVSPAPYSYAINISHTPYNEPLFPIRVKKVSPKKKVKARNLSESESIPKWAKRLSGEETYNQKPYSFNFSNIYPSAEPEKLPIIPPKRPKSQQQARKIYSSVPFNQKQLSVSAKRQIHQRNLNSTTRFP